MHTDNFTATEDAGVGLTARSADTGTPAGEARSFGNPADQLAAEARRGAKYVTDRALAAAAAAKGQTKETYEDLARRTQVAASRVDPYVRENPYSSLALVALAGVTLGLLAAIRGQRTTFITPRS